MSGLVRDVMMHAPVVPPGATGEYVYDLLSEDEDLLVIAVVEDGRPVGLVSRDRFFLKMADRHGRALFGRRPITFLMSRTPLIVEGATPVADLNDLIVRDCPSALMEGFIVTRDGEYAGVGTALELFRTMSHESAERNHKLSVLAEQLGRARIEALAASKAKSEFLATMSHEIRTPLNGVLGVAQLLMATELNREQEDFVRVINDSGQILLRLLNDVLDLSRIEAGRMDLDVKDVDLSHVIEESIDMVVSKAEDTQIAVRADITGDLGMIRADERRIRQVLFNLISNSLRFTDSGGEIVVSSQRVGDMVTLSVRDNGRGLAADKRATSFDSFVSGDQRGAGLGLALVKHFIDLHGGTVGMKPVDGGGLEVTCWLPAQAMRAVSAQRELLLSENVVPS